MREVEVKSVVDDFEGRQARARAAGARLLFVGTLHDRRYDKPDRSMIARDHVLRLRVQRAGEQVEAWLDWKGPTMYEAGYKVREEISVPVADAPGIALLLERLDYVVTIEIEREIVTYELGNAVVRFERYPRMDDLVEVEGDPDAIERAIAALGMPRTGFTSERLPDFTRRFEERTNTRAALSARELAGDYRYDVAEA